MIRIPISVEIDRPVEEVFAYVTDPATLAEWQDTTLSATQETDGPMGVGTRLHEVHSAPFGKRVDSTVEVAAFEPNARFDLRIVDGPLPIHADHTFTATDGGGTRVDFVAHGEPTGAMRLAQPVLRLVLKRQFSGYYRKLKERLEVN